MLLKSVYLKGPVIAVATFVERCDRKMLIPSGVWRSDSNTFGFIDEIKRDIESNQVIIVNPDKFEQAEKEPVSFLKDILAKEGVRQVMIADRFEAAQGLIVLGKMNRYGSIDCSIFSGWAKIQSEIDQVERLQSAGLMAFLQGLICHENRSVPHWLTIT